MPIKPIRLAVMAVLLAACAARYPAGDTTERERVAARVRELGPAFSSGDEARFLALLEDDATWMPPDHPVLVGKAAIAPWFRASHERLDQRFEFSPEDVEVRGDWAIVRASVGGAVTPRAGGPTRQVNNKALLVLVRQRGGEWRFSHDAWNRNAVP